MGIAEPKFWQLSSLRFSCDSLAVRLSQVFFPSNVLCFFTKSLSENQTEDSYLF